MRANPGGEIAPSEVVGRDELIESLWDALEVQSVLLVSERRFGKTTTTKKMRSAPREGWVVIWRDLEDIGTAAEFAERVCQGMEEYLSRSSRRLSKVRSFMEEIGGAEVGGVIRLPQLARGHWKTTLEKAFEDLAEAQEGRVLFVWDELPLMLQKIFDREGEGAAMDVLEVLRHLRQTHGSRFPMMYCGSIGLHHVLRNLATSGDPNTSVNDLRTIELQPLHPIHSASLVRQLLEGERINCAEPEAVCARVGELVDHVPFYVHAVVERMKASGSTPTIALVEQVVGRAVVDAHDRWHLAHYYERLSGYYGEFGAGRAIRVLDELAVVRVARSLRELHQALAAGSAPPDEEDLRTLLRLLARDHYLTRREDGRYAFRFGLIKRWWRVSRDLGEERA